MMRRWLAALVVLVAAWPRAALAQQTIPTPFIERCDLAINGSYRATSKPFDSTLTSPLFGEIKTVATSYDVPAAPAFDMDVRCEHRKGLGFRVGLSYYSRSSPAGVSASIPHPLLFNQPRMVTGDTTALRHAELGVQFNGVWVKYFSDRVLMAVFGGPVLTKVTQGLVTDATEASRYPFDQATFDTAVTTEHVKWATGFDAGADATVMLTDTLGIGATVQYQRAKVSLATSSGSSVDFDLGGLQVGAGVRIRF